MLQVQDKKKKSVSGNETNLFALHRPAPKQLLLLWPMSKVKRCFLQAFMKTVKRRGHFIFRFLADYTHVTSSLKKSLWDFLVFCEVRIVQLALGFNFRENIRSHHFHPPLITGQVKYSQLIPPNKELYWLQARRIYKKCQLIRGLRLLLCQIVVHFNSNQIYI